MAKEPTLSPTERERLEKGVSNKPPVAVKPPPPPPPPPMKK